MNRRSFLAFMAATPVLAPVAAEAAKAAATPRIRFESFTGFTQFEELQFKPISLAASYPESISVGALREAYESCPKADYTSFIIHQHCVPNRLFGASVNAAGEAI